MLSLPKKMCDGHVEEWKFIATARGNPSASALGGIATRAIDRRHENMVQCATQEAVEGTPKEKTV